MDLSFQDFGATLIIGAYVVIGVELLLYIFFGTNLYFRLEIRNKLTQLSTVGLLIAFCFAIGMLMEGASNVIVDKYKKDKLINTLLPSEKSIRKEVLFKIVNKSPDKIRNNSLPSEKTVKEIKATSLGLELAKLGLLSRYGGINRKAVERYILSKKDLIEFEEDLGKIASVVYYPAKNRVYREPNYYDELKHIQTKINFTRSFSLVSILLVLVTIIFAAVRYPSAKINNFRKLWMVICIVFAFILVHFIGRFVFKWEEMEFDKRAFGYFISLHEVKPEDTKFPKTLGYSGMVQLDNKRFLVVHDTKGDSRENRFGILTFNQNSSLIYSLVLTDWGDTVGDPASDLEAICRIPGSKYEFLACESGYYQGRYGRIFHIEILHENDDWVAVVKGVFSLPRDTDNVEGIACIGTKDDSLVIILGERGGSELNPQGKLRWGLLNLDFPNTIFRIQGEKPFAAPDWPDDAMNRDCADLYIDNQKHLWIAATEDAGDKGPFKSVIYDVGIVNIKEMEHSLLKEKPIAAWRLDGVKVEALGAPVIPESKLSIATDDEHYGGIWRPLFPLYP
ncbi:MAG: hypothetical protein SCARUB_00829 [Candidatus Scalindua rubra]|uniref:Uncharacterized protein n=1 Tax=Candidatus Scalindua rubra TaxID=1872076 RepID=A0A1E3XEJ5_9BACT|nr:MAG: hypothetical protein SCARUB_00829 [Candidatus Scalindua rubra]